MATRPTSLDHNLTATPVVSGNPANTIPTEYAQRLFAQFLETTFANLANGANNNSGNTYTANSVDNISTANPANNPRPKRRKKVQKLFTPTLPAIPEDGELEEDGRIGFN